jgi:hypothetical protein
MSADGRVKESRAPIMGRVTGKGLEGSLKETCRMGEVETMVWIVLRE